MTERKKEIIQTASVLFRKQGYKAVSMRQLAQEIGVKAASLYNHISSKQELLSMLILGVADRFTSGMEGIKNKPVSPLDKIKEVMLLHIEITLDDPGGMESLQNNWLYLEGESLVAYKRQRNTYEDNLRNIIKEGIKGGQIKDVNPEIIIFSMLTALRSLYIWYPRQEDIEPEKLKKDLITVMLQGVEKGETAK